jgi:predicted transposase YdaD
MGTKDVISKSIFQRIVRDFATYLFDLPLTEVELLDTEKQRIETRQADLVARVEDQTGQVFILHIEIQTYNDPLMPQRMLRYLADLLLAYPSLSVRQYLVYLGKDNLRMAEGLQSEQLSYHYPTIDMRTIDCQTLLQQDSPDAWVLAVLADFKTYPARDIVQDILARLMQRLHDQPPRLREYVSMLEILASNRDLNLNISEEFEMLRIDFEKLPTYQMGWKKGMERGIEKGIEKAHTQALAIATRLLARGIEPAQVAVLTDLPLAEIEALSPTPNA